MKLNNRNRLGKDAVAEATASVNLAKGYYLTRENGDGLGRVLPVGAEPRLTVCLVTACFSAAITDWRAVDEPEG